MLIFDNNVLSNNHLDNPVFFVLMCSMNIMVETSGRDIGMYHYINHFFPDSSYRKLVVHFSINELSHAERSVDTRMTGEMKRGREVINDPNRTVYDVIQVNAGGPYGSSVLSGVQQAEQKVWQQVTQHNSKTARVASSWLKASLCITADADVTRWTASSCGARSSEQGQSKTIERNPRSESFSFSSLLPATVSPGSASPPSSTELRANM